MSITLELGFALDEKSPQRWCGHTANYSLFCSPWWARTTQHSLWLMEALYAHWHQHWSSGALGISPGVASLFSGVDRMVIKNRARFGLLPKLNTSSAPPLAAFSRQQRLPFPCWACKAFTHQRPRGLWKPPMCQYQSTNGSHVFAEWKKPGILGIQTCLIVNGSKAETLFFFFNSLLFLGCWPPSWLAMDNAILNDPTPKHEG